MRSLGRAAVALAAVVAMGAGTMAAQSHDWQIDPAHSQAEFAAGQVQGSFRGVNGVVHFEAGNPNAWTVDATIDANTLDTGDAGRDNGLKSGSGLDAAKYPAITFKSTGVKLDSSSGYQVRGKLTLHGVTKAVTLILDSPGDAKAGMDAKRVHRDFHASTTISLKEFGIKASGGVGDKVKVTLDVEAVVK